MDFSNTLDGFTVGDSVSVNTNSNIGIVQDAIRALFIQSDTLGNSFPAAVLTNHSWAPLADCSRVQA